ncbi:MAG: prepilin-type N-terminal cleavage/methylation domain-containing protein, partial [Terrimicrobiaceae bacterium]|nr:prepilin-type N-terminal cleavage/methylation domain-containing protein [Terrimicrobiaceae bacterium]
MRRTGYTLLEMLVCVAVMAVLLVAIAPAVWKVYASSSLAVSANNVRQLTAGAVQYLADNDHRFWKFRQSGSTKIDDAGNTIKGTLYWFGFESLASAASGEGNRTFDPSQGPLAGYVPKGIQPDPSFSLQGFAFKPKYKSGYIGVGYNVVLAGGWVGAGRPMSYWQLSDPSRVAVFATSAQVNNFQSPASASHPMIEEFYGFDERETTIHFRH